MNANAQVTPELKKTIIKRIKIILNIGSNSIKRKAINE